MRGPCKNSDQNLDFEQNYRKVLGSATLPMDRASERDKEKKNQGDNEIKR